jgi:hypothetical protein
MNNQIPAVIRILVLLEGTGVSGPAKNLLEFCRLSQTLAAPQAVKIAVALRAGH